MTHESGRSLVETLGMLAIMGILSIVGISAYRSAMDKHKANTLISEAQKRAVIIAGQIGFNGINGNQPSLAEFSPYDNGLFDSSKVYYKEDGLTGQFGIKVLNVKKSVCQNILNTIGDNTPIRRISKADALTTPITSCDDEEDYVIIYNEGMNEISNPNDFTEDVCEDKGYNWCNSIKACISGSNICPSYLCKNNSCPNGCQRCVNGYCQELCLTNQTCTKGSSDSEYLCKNIPQSCENCSKDQYCEITSEQNDCSNPDKGICMDKEENFELLKKTILFSDNTNLEVYKSPQIMNWWTANNWCRIHNKRMVSLKDLHCTKQSCPERNAITSLGLSGRAWLADTSSSCTAYDVNLNNSAAIGSTIKFYYKKYVGYNLYALCK